MPDKEMVQAVLDAIGVTCAGRSESGRSRCDHHDEDCAAPENVIHVILTNCVTINNAAREEWEFCPSRSRCPN